VLTFRKPLIPAVKATWLKSHGDFSAAISS
jgi:hypothetical protein